MSEQHQYLYRIQPTRPAMLTEGPTPQEQEATVRHFRYLQKLVAQGTVLLAGRTQNSDPSAFGIVIFQADSDAAARAIVDNDPVVIAGVMNAELFPYRVALAADTIPT